MKRSQLMTAAVLAGLALLAGGCSTGDQGPDLALTVNSLEDTAAPPSGTVTLRSALAAAGPGDPITFNESLDGETILLTVVGDAHSILGGEVYVANAFSGYEDRDYGKSALYTHQDVVIDASGLPHGITLKWDGGETSHARVLAVYGDLVMKNVTVAGGYSESEAIGGTQPYTLARGAGLAVWGQARLDNCTITGNRCVGESGSA